jgi:hypothetical protein
MQKTLIRWSVQAMLRSLAFFARRPAFNAVTSGLTRGLALFTIRAKKIGSATSVEELGPLWQRSFPSKKQVPIESVQGNTVIAHIHTPCPLRGTGDLHACHRMMQFDREIVGRAGGHFVVLESQASPGRTSCRVAMRLKGEDISDLTPAHEHAGA